MNDARRKMRVLLDELAEQQRKTATAVAKGKK
jgi:hypothetical protein